MMHLSLAVLSVLASSVLSSNLLPAPIQPRQSSSSLADKYPAYNISVPVDHFHNDSRYEPHSDAFFNLRYWFDASHYRQGGPVIVLQGGETSGAGRLPYLDHGIVAELAEAVGGIGVVIEHRYYGESFPVEDLSTENFRFLTTDQALADQAYFAQNVVFPGLENMNLTAPGTPYIAYGGSYAGAFVAFLRKLYPQATWGAISSSGVTEAYYDFWQYYEPVRKYGPQDCIDTHTKLINIADKILLADNQTAKTQLKAAFGMDGISYDDDFANAISYGVGFWQSRNWDPAVGDDTFELYCANITSNTVSNSDSLSSAADGSTLSDLITTAGYSPDDFSTPLTNWISWFNITILSGCTETLPNDNTTLDLDACFGNHDANATKYTDRSTENSETLSWPYQYCTQWGYLQSGSTVPENLLPLISRLVSVEWNMLICKNAFNITTPADTPYINKLGGYTFSYSRLAIIGGEADPWRGVSGLADQVLENSDFNQSTTSLELAGGDPGDGSNVGTLSEPLIVIPGAVHHWDENGVTKDKYTREFPPKEIKQAKALLKKTVREWMRQWVEYCNSEGSGSCTYKYTGPRGHGPKGQGSCGSGHGSHGNGNGGGWGSW